MSPTPIPSTPPAPRALRLCVLGSGSGGNSTVIQYGRQVVLLDAGLGPRVTTQRLRALGLGLENITALLLTHLDQDHFRPAWLNTIARYNLPVYLHQWHVEQWRSMDVAAEVERRDLLQPFALTPFGLPDDAGTLHVTPVALPHDDKGTIGYRFDTAGHGVDAHGSAIGYATDLGHVPAALVELFTHGGGVDVLAIESNYDPIMQRTSTRPWFLKQRIMGGHGHLSNQQAYEFVTAVQQRSRHGRPGQVVLLHRSAQCNCPEIVRRTFAQDPSLPPRLTLTDPRRRTPWIEAAAPLSLRQGQMAFDFV